MNLIRMKPARINIILKCLIILLLEISFFLPGYSGHQPDSTQKSVITSEAFDFREKVFLHIDRKLYLSGETIRFKGYCVHQTYNLPVDLSKVLYVEIINNQNQQILAEKIKLTGGTGHGYINIPGSMQTGTYYLRAYTRWMTNFDPEYYFAEKIFIINPFLPLETRADTGEISNHYFVHIYAEGDKLKNEQKNEIAFRAIDAKGNPVDLKGWVVGASGDTITSFETWEYGFGLIAFTPHSGDRYSIITINSEGMGINLPLSVPVGDTTEINNSTDNLKTENNDRFNITVQQSGSLYSVREKVVFTIKTTDQSGKPVAANMSLSVSKSEKHLNFYHKNISQYLNSTSFIPASSMAPDDQVPFSAYDSILLKRILGIIYSSISVKDTGKAFLPDGRYILPETRGITIGGTVYNNMNREPVPDFGIYLASPARHAQLYKHRSGPDGRFNVELYEQYGWGDIIVMPSAPSNDHTFELDENFPGKPGSFHSSSFWPDEQTIRYINRLMVNLQIEKAFSVNKEGSDNRSTYELPDIFGDPDELIRLEDYIRLPAVEELFFELVRSVNIKRRKNNFELNITDYSSQLALPGEPLLLLDGVPVTDVNAVILYLDPVDIERIEVFSDWYIQGNEFYFSIINMITRQADFRHFDLPGYAIRKPFQFFQYPVPFHAPDYASDNDNLKTIPDFRNLLYWNPEVITNMDGTVTVSFCTSDDISDYSVVIQGITEQGQSGYLEEIISVTNSPGDSKSPGELVTIPPAIANHK